tara:strand:+ start:945 stop:1400 length:456 start_codon:yes stop_codon:yes gene_type:complete
MDKKSIILISVLFVLLIFGMFVYAHLKQSEMNATQNVALVAGTKPEAEGKQSDSVGVVLHAVEVSGTRTTKLTGTIGPLTDCQQSTLTPAINYEPEIDVVLSFSVINQPSCDPSYIDRPENRSFTVGLPVRQVHKIRAVVDGVEVPVEDVK